MIGRIVAQYQLTEKLGAGGMGEIYRALDTRLSRTVAIKVLPDSQTGDPERRRRFLQEARAASALNHSNIITIHDVVFEGDTAFMVMEFIGGETLAERIVSGPMPVSEVLNYAVQMADALAAAHDAGIVHRDLKPGNVMITARGIVKVLDFGLAKRSIFSTSATALTDATVTVAGAPLTVEGSILGTVSYMSPEQAEGRAVDGRSDIFSFGVLLYEMLTGRRPFTGDSTLSTLSAILRDDAPRMSQRTPAVPGPLDDLVGRCLAKRPDQRWENMLQLRDALATLRTVPEAPSPRPQRFPMLAVVSVTAAFLVAGTVWFATGMRRAAPQPQTLPAAAALPAQSDVLTNDQVISMLRAKVPSPVIKQQIRSSRTNFDFSVSAIIRLTEAGASADVIETMRDPTRPIPATAQPKTPGTAPAVSLPSDPTAAEPPPTPSAPAAATVEVTVPDALPFAIELAEDVAAEAEPGRPIRFKVSKELRIGETVVVPLHAEVVGEVVDGAKRKLIGGTKLTFRLRTVAVGGVALNLRVGPSERNSRRPVESASGPKPPRGIAAVIGTEYLAYTDGEQIVYLSK
jgi:serine/threonine protein kinase